MTHLVTHQTGTIMVEKDHIEAAGEALEDLEVLEVPEVPEVVIVGSERKLRTQIKVLFAYHFRPVYIYLIVLCLSIKSIKFNISNIRVLRRRSLR